MAAFAIVEIPDLIRNIDVKKVMLSWYILLNACY